MNSTYVLIALGGIVGGFLGCWLVMRSAAIRHANHIRQLDAALHDRDRETFRNEREHRENIKCLEGEHADVLKQERGAAFEEGRKLGQTEGERDRIREITTKESEFEDRLRKECKRAADEARDQVRMQFEQQTKLFSVEVRPYVEVNEVGTYLRTKREEKAGYRYQLLVNGIPAFQPHVIIDSIDVRAKSKDENIDRLVDLAMQAAQTAVETYLGGAGQFVKLGKVIRRLPDTGQ